MEIVMTTTNITFENYNEYPKGTLVEFFFGAYYPPVEGMVTGYEIVAATKWFPALVRLKAEYIDIETEQLVETTITQLNDVGVGVYLLETATPIENKKVSKWA